MKTEFKDVAHLYIGCDVQTSYRLESTQGQPMGKAIGRLIDVDLFLPNQIGVQLDFQKETIHTTTLPVDSCKPILRPLSDMTDEERRSLWKLVYNRSFIGNNIIFFETKTPRWVMSSGVERLGIQLNGEVYYDSDLQNYKFNQHLITLFYLKQGFDIFSLIESEQAIDKTKINKS